MIQRLRNSQFVKNVALLLSGNVIGQLIPILASVLLTRLYSPNDFAVLAYFLTITGIISVIAGGRYEVAIMLPKENVKANALYVISIIFTSIFTLLITLFCFLFGEKFALIFNAKELIQFIYLIPISIFLIGVYQAANFYSNRLSKYKLMSGTLVSRSVFTSATNITIGWMKYLPGGLIIGTLVGQFVAAFLLTLGCFKEVLKEFPAKDDILLSMREFKDFPLKNGVSIFFNLLANQVPILLIGYLFQNNDIVGWYALVLRVLNLPLMTIGKSVSQVFYQQTNQMDRTSHRDLFLKTSKALFILILIPSFVLLFSGPLLFGFVFGDVWEVSGHYAQIFMLFYVLRFIFSPQSTLLISSGRLKTELIFNVSFFVFQILSVIIGYEIGDYIYSFIFMSFTGFVHFLILGRILFKSSIQLDNEKSN